MLLRICLIIAIVAGLGAGVVGFVYVKKVITDTISERDDFHKQRDDESAAKVAAQTKLKKTEGELASTKSKLSQTEEQLQQETAKAQELDKKVTDLTADLDRVKTDRDTAQQQLALWDQIGLKPTQVKGLIDDLAKTKTERDAITVENKILLKKKNDLQAKLDQFFGVGQNIEEPPGLRGTVLAVDPKFDFVVLNIGEDNGVIERGEMMINRGGRLIGKVRIASVNKNRCIANILSDWKSGDVMEGDQVID